MIAVLESVPITEEQLEHLRYLHATAERYKDSIFNRAYTLMTAAGIQVGLTAAFAALFRNTRGDLWATMLRADVAIVLLLNVCAAASALHAIMPHQSVSAVRLLLSKLTREKQPARTLVADPLLSSFNRVCEMEKSAFMSQVGTASVSVLFADLAITYFNLCHIVSARYASLRRAFIYEEIALLLWASVGVMAII
ncbi:MAG TPA: hypothetical protein VNN25_12625 [Thermoanaerobaculia bacterium]|nr:hypothetical protein [Thermoanaerobaculia bacterium]